MSARVPVITGLGIVTAAGMGVNDVWDAIGRGISGLKPLRLFQSPRYGQVPTGEIQQDLAALGAPLRGSRSDRLGWLAARDAIESSGIDLERIGDRAGILMGSSVGGSFDSERFLTKLIRTGKMRARPTRFHECVSVVDIIANDFGLYGPSMAVATACSSGALAIAAAAEMIQAGEAEVMLAGGADSLSRMTWGGFHSLLLVDPSGCKPFDVKRAGMSLAEGAAVLVLESEETARQRGAAILARLTGWGASCDAHHATAPHPEGAGALAAMESALRRAGLAAQAIDYVNAHGTGTRDNDLAEARALKKLFGDHVPPFSSTKGFFGHSLAASGAIEAVVCIEALRRQQLPPNPGYTATDPAIGIEPVKTLRGANITHAMSNSFGFGGNNAVLIISRAESPANTRPPRPTPVKIVGLSVIGPGKIATREIGEPLPAGSVAVHACEDEIDLPMLTSSQRRRLNRLSQMILQCASRSHARNPAQRLAISFGTGLGFMSSAGAFIENYISKEEREPMPSQFPASVHNAAAGQAAIYLGAHGMNSAPTAGEISFECALWLAMSQLANEEADCALAGAADELNKYPLSIGQRWGLWTERIKPGEGAVSVSLTAAEKGSTLGKIAALRIGRYRRPFDAQREASWIGSAVDLGTVDVLLSGAGGTPALDPMYGAVAAALSSMTGGRLRHQTYKEHCGEYHSASGFGFSVALSIARQTGHGVLLYTLGLRGAKALCSVEP